MIIRTIFFPFFYSCTVLFFGEWGAKPEDTEAGCPWLDLVFGAGDGTKGDEKGVMEGK